MPFIAVVVFPSGDIVFCFVYAASLGFNFDAICAFLLEFEDVAVHGSRCHAARLAHAIYELALSLHVAPLVITTVLKVIALEIAHLYQLLGQQLQKVGETDLLEIDRVNRLGRMISIAYE